MNQTKPRSQCAIAVLPLQGFTWLARLSIPGRCPGLYYLAPSGQLLRLTSPLGANLNKLVNEILKKLLPPALIRHHVPLLQHIAFQFLETRFPRLDLFPDAAVPRAIAPTHELRQPAVLANRSRSFQSTR